jgi:hypothetical protein
MNIQKIIKNKYLYYVACVLAAINLLGYISQGSMECILLFAVGTYAANHFTKNRTLDIFVGLFAANVLFGCGRIKEGMATPSETIEKVSADVASAKRKTCTGKNKEWNEDKQECLDKAVAALDTANENLKKAAKK